MLQLALFDLRRRLAPDARRLRAACLRQLAGIPPDLRPDMGISDARLIDLAEAQAAQALADRRAAEARHLLAALNRIARRRGFPPLRWKLPAGG